MPTSGQRVGEYLLDQKIGGGTFGEVWRAHHHVWVDQLVAIKIPTDSQYLRELQREGVAIHGLVHPNIVRAIGFDPYADPAYLTMEYAVDSAALFNPSIVAHPDQSDLPTGAVRFLMSLRATGEGHVSSIVFRARRHRRVRHRGRDQGDGFWPG